MGSWQWPQNANAPSTTKQQYKRVGQSMMLLIQYSAQAAVLSAVSTTCIRPIEYHVEQAGLCLPVEAAS